MQATQTETSQIERYPSRVIQWDKYASIRCKPRRLIQDFDTTGYFYPIDKQPIADHPLIKTMGDSAIGYILIQAAYKFMTDLAIVEVEMVNGICGKIYNRSINFNYTDEMRQDVLTIIIDEAHHALIAKDYMQQVEQFTGVKPLKREPITELAQTIELFRTQVNHEQMPAYDLLCLCVGENTFTNQLFEMARAETVNEFYHVVMTDHMLDEGRHQSILAYLLKHSWKQFDEELKLFLGKMLPEFIYTYLKPDLQMIDDKLLLESLDLSNSQISQIMNDIHFEHSYDRMKLTNPVYKNLMRMLERVGILSHPGTRKEFSRYNLL